MKRWLRSLSFQELSPLNLTPIESPTSPTTPPGAKCRIQYLSPVRENDCLGAVGTNAVSNISIFNADKTDEEAAEYRYGTGSTRLVSTATTSSTRFPSDIQKRPGQEIFTREVKAKVQGNTTNEQDGSTESKRLSSRTADLVQKVHALKERELALVQRLRSLKTINQDDERRLNQFIDVLRQSPLSPLSPHATKNAAEHEQAEQTLTKLERLFVRSTESWEKAEKKLLTVKKDLAFAREGLETELLKLSSEDEQTDVLKSSDRSVYTEHASHRLEKFMQELRAHETDLDGSKAKSISNVSPDLLTLPAPAKVPSSNIDRGPPRSTLEEALERANCRLTTAQVNFDNLPNQYALDAQTYHETYQSCMKTVTDFDLEHLVQGQEASRELTEAENALERLKKQIFATEQEKRKQKQGHATEDSAHYPIDQTSTFLTHPEDATILARELQDALRSVDRIRVERWRRHIVVPSSSSPDSDSDTVADDDQESDSVSVSPSTSPPPRPRPQAKRNQLDPTITALPDLTCGESICGMSSGRSRLRITRWNQSLPRASHISSPSRSSPRQNPPPGPVVHHQTTTPAPTTRKGGPGHRRKRSVVDVVRNSDAYRRNGSFSGPATGGAAAGGSRPDDSEEGSRTLPRERMAILHVDEYVSPVPAPAPVPATTPPPPRQPQQQPPHHPGALEKRASEHERDPTGGKGTPPRDEWREAWWTTKAPLDPARRQGGRSRSRRQRQGGSRRERGPPEWI